MPLLDVTDLLLDPDFVETIEVIRTTQDVNDRGRVDAKPVTLTPIGSIQPDHPEPVEITDDAERTKSRITVHAYNFRFLGPTDTTSPDKVRFQGKDYLVMRVLDWSRFGKGFTAAECEIQAPVGSGEA